MMKPCSIGRRSAGPRRHSRAFALPIGAVCVAGLLWLAPQVGAQLPAARLEALVPAGGRPGTTVEITIHGADLDDVTELRFTHPGIAAKPVMLELGPFDAPPFGSGPQVAENRFEVSIAADVPPGAYAVRVLGRYGVSAPRTFFVDSLPVVLGVEPDGPGEIPIIPVPGIVDGGFGAPGDVDRYWVDAKSGQRIAIKAVARQIDSRARPVLSLEAADGRVIGTARPEGGADPVLAATVPSDGRYTIRLQDEIHGGGADHPYRLVLSDAPWLAAIFPPAGLPGSNDEYTLFGRNLPGGNKGATILDGAALEELRLRISIPADITGRMVFDGRLEPAQFAIDGVGVHVDGPGGRSNELLLSAASAPLVREADANDRPDSAQKLIPPCEVAGMFHPRRDVDWYTFEAKKDERLWIEVWSHRIGAPVDPALVIQRVEPPAEGAAMEKVTVVATIDDAGQAAGMSDITRRHGGREFDQRSFDPAVLFTAPADGTYRLLIRESRSQIRDDPRLAYRLVVRPPQPDFRIVAVPVDTAGAVLLRKGGREMIRVVVARLDGFDGEVTVSAAGFPAGVTAAEIVIGPGSSVGYLTLSADPAAAAAQGAIEISGRATVSGQVVTRGARIGTALDSLQFVQPDGQGPSSRARLIDRLVVSVSADETAKVTLGIGDGKVIETSRGGIVKVPWTATRQDGAGGTINGFVLGLPAGMTAPQVAIGGGNAGEFELRPPAAIRPGTYSLILAGSMTGLQYARNPDSATKAKAQADAFAAVVTEVQSLAQKSQQESQAAATALASATAEATSMQQARSAAEQAALQAAVALTTAEQALAAAAKQAEGMPGDAALGELVVKARTTRDEAIAKGKVAAAALELATMKRDEGAEKQRVTAATKETMELAAQEALKRMQLALQEKQRLDQKSQQTQTQSAPRGVNLNIPSPPVTVRVAEHPLQVSGLPDRLQVKQGDMVEVPFRVERLYGFTGDVSLQCQPPATASGFPQAAVNLPGAMADGKIVVSLPPTATSGEHTVPVRFSLNFNGQPLSFEKPVVFAVEQVAPATPK